MSWRTRRRGSSKQKGLKFKTRQKTAERCGGRFQPPKPTEEEGERYLQSLVTETKTHDINAVIEKMRGEGKK